MFDFLPHQLMTVHRGASDSNYTGLSPRIWGHVTGSITEPDSSKRLVLAGSDFVNFKAENSYVDCHADGGAMTGFITDDGTIKGATDEKGGVVHLLQGATDNDEIWLTSGDNIGQLGQISDTAADAHLTAFETRIKVSDLTDGVCSMFCGLASPGLAADNTKVNDTGVLKTTSAFIGFDNLLDGNGIDFVYQAASQTIQRLITDIHVPVADTYVKLGFVYDPNAPTAKRIKIYVNNVENGTYVTGALIEADTFPDAEALAWLSGQKNTIGTTPATNEHAIDWWAFAQVIDLQGPSKVNGDPIV